MDAPCEGELLFEDNFDRFDAAKWHVEQRYTGQPDHEFGVYLNRSDIVRVQNQQLAIDVIRLGEDFDMQSVSVDSSNGSSTSDAQQPPNYSPPIGLGQITTANSFRFLYGRVEIRARLPYADWVFPQLFLQPADNAYGNVAYASGQMRVAYATSGEPLSGGILLGASAPFRMLDVCRAGGGTGADDDVEWRDEFHVYTLLWRPDSIRVSVDNRTYCHIVPPFAERRVNGYAAAAAGSWQRDARDRMVPFDRPFYVTLGVGVGGLNDYSDVTHREYPGGAKPWRNDDVSANRAFWESVRERQEWPGSGATLLVDYVRVYAL